MGSVLLVLQLIVAVFMVAVILMQRSNGGALSGLGGDSGIGGLISARGKGNILTRITAVLATLFFVLSMALSIYFSRIEFAQKVSVLDTPTASSSLPATEEAAATEATEDEANSSSPEASEPEVPVAE